MFNTRPLRIMIHAEFALPTGFGNESEAIADALHNMKTEIGTKKYEVVVMQLGVSTHPFEARVEKPYQVIPMYGNRAAAKFGEDYAADLVSRVRPDVVLTFGDTWMIDFWNDTNRIPRELRRTFKLVGYVAIDGYPVPGDWINKYKAFDKVIAFTKFGKEAIDERAKEMGISLNTSYIYHGIDNQIFRPLPKEEIEKFKLSKNLKDKKIIGMFSRNQPRKHHPEFIESAIEILKRTDNDPNILFYMHCMELDAGWNLLELAEDADRMNLRERFLKYKNIKPGQKIPEKSWTLKNRIFYPGIKNLQVGYSREHLNMMYNICDAHVLLTSGEGMGLTVIESLSAGVPTFTNNYAASAELIIDSGGGEVIGARDYTYRGSDHNFIRPHTDYDDLVSKVLPVLNDPKLRQRYSKKARAYAWNLSRPIVMEDWDRELSDLFVYKNIKQKAEVL